MKKIPVVVVLGHIDHGKSTLLEAIKKEFKITEKEAGGITQHIGAYKVDHQGKKITFIDTPGHEAFSEMRSRGAKIADVAILIVAADEGIKPQTKEAIEIIKKTNIPMVIALNKIDKQNADPQKVKSELQKENVLVEEFGGDVPAVETSAKTGQGINELLEIINLLWEMSAKESEVEAFPQAFVIESYLDALRGPTVTLILEKGKIKTGDIIGSSSTFGRIKTLEDFQLKPTKEALPGDPVIITGLEEVPALGESFQKFSSLEEANANIKISPPLVFESIPETEKALNVILKADVKGTLEVIEKIFRDLTQEGKKINIIRAEVGEVNFSDLKSAETTSSKIISFRAKVSSQIGDSAKQKNIDILSSDIIYDLVDGVRKLMEKEKVQKKKVREEIGKIKVLVVFKTQSQKRKNYRQIVGGKVIEGEVKKGDLEVEREKGKSGKIIELQEQKKKIEMAKTGKEVGILYEGDVKIKEGDILIIYEYVEAS